MLGEVEHRDKGRISLPSWHPLSKCQVRDVSVRLEGNPCGGIVEGMLSIWGQEG